MSPDYTVPLSISISLSMTLLRTNDQPVGPITPRLLPVTIVHAPDAAHLQQRLSPPPLLQVAMLNRSTLKLSTPYPNCGFMTTPPPQQLQVAPHPRVSDIFCEYNSLSEAQHSHGTHQCSDACTDRPESTRRRRGGGSSRRV